MLIIIANKKSDNICFVCFRENFGAINEGFGVVNEGLGAVNENSGKRPEDTVGHKKKKSDRINFVNMKCILPKKMVFLGK